MGDAASGGMSRDRTLAEGAHDRWTLAEGEVLGGYRVIRPLGRGGMGEVYEVEHEVLGKRFALKLVLPRLSGMPGFIERFMREARVTANLEHPGVVRVDDFGSDRDLYWLRMEYVEGVDAARTLAAKDAKGAGGDTLRAETNKVAQTSPSPGTGDSTVEARKVSPPHAPALVSSERAVSLEDLQGLAPGGRLPEPLVARVTGQVLEALAYAHGRGVVHRDLKPANVLLKHEDDELVAKVSDFGLVKLVGEEWLRSAAELSISRAGAELSAAATAGPRGDEAPLGPGESTRSLVGTYEYMSPEQKRGEATAASDCYAVGLMVYRLLTGRRELGLRRASEIVPGIDPGWDALLLRALEEEPAARFADAREMLGMLPGPATAGRFDSRAAEPGTRRQVAVLIASVLLSLLGPLRAWTGPISCILALVSGIVGRSYVLVVLTSFLGLMAGGGLWHLIGRQWTGFSRAVAVGVLCSVPGLVACLVRHRRTAVPEGAQDDDRA